MSQKLNILKRRDDFVAVASFGRKSVTRGFILQIRPHPGSFPDSLPTVRIGFTATKKIGNAVIRNRAKRRLRALAREILPLHAPHGHDFVLIARAVTPTIPYATMRDDLLQALARIRTDHPAA